MRAGLSTSSVPNSSRARKAEAERIPVLQGTFQPYQAGFAEKKISAFVTGANEYSDGFQQNSAFVKNAATGVFSKRPGVGAEVRGFESASRIGCHPGAYRDWNGEKERQANKLEDYQKTERNLLNAGYDRAGNARFNVSAGAAIMSSMFTSSAR